MNETKMGNNPEQSLEKQFSNLIFEYEEIKKKLFEIDREVVARGNEEEFKEWAMWGGWKNSKSRLF